MKKLIFTPLLFLFLLFSPLSTLASTAANKVQSIFDKSRRKLEDPPKSLRADRRGDNTSIFASGTRVNNDRRGPAQESANAESEGVQVAPVRPVPKAQPVNTQSSSHPYTQRMRAEKRDRGLNNLAFSGERVFGIGFMGAGAYGIFGGEVDFKINNHWSAGFGIGTGMAYSTWALHARHYLHQGPFSTFIKFGYANWFLGQMPRNKDVSPSYLAERFFSDDSGKLVTQKRVHLVYPSIGMDYQHDSGLAFNVLLQYLISASDFSGALYGSFGFFYYF